jgi:hypothetical protein
MKTKALIVLAALVVAACAELAGKPAAKHCEKGLCPVEVTVLEGCKVQVPVPEPLHVPKGNHLIKWTISAATPQKYVFARNGIEFPPGGPFSFPQPQPRLFVLNDNNPGGTTTSHKYTIFIIGGTERCYLDPYVINDP